MKKINHHVLIAVIVTVILLAMFADPALASPGGKIAKAAFETFWGRIALVLLTIIFLPLICYAILREKLAERRARKDLRYMAGYSAQFDWLNIQQRVKDCFRRVHSAWEQEELAQVSSWMTDWYWQNQQLLYLQRWQQEGLQNICKVKKITAIKPLLFAHRNHGDEHQGSIVVISISAKMQDYLQERASGKIVEGSKKYKEVETIWSLTMEDGVWKVSDIEEGSMSLTYTKLTRELPAIESTIISQLRT